MNTMNLLKIMKRSWDEWHQERLDIYGLKAIILEEEQKNYDCSDEEIQLEKRNLAYHFMNQLSYYEVPYNMQMFRDFLLHAHQICDSSMIRVLIALLESETVFINRLFELEINLHLLKLYQMFWLGNDSSKLDLSVNFAEYPQVHFNQFEQITIFKQETKKESKYEQVDIKQYERTSKAAKNLVNKIKNLNYQEKNDFSIFIETHAKENEVIKELMLDQLDKIHAKTVVNKEEDYPLMRYLKQ